MKHLIRGEVVQKRGGKSVDNVDSLLTWIRGLNPLGLLIVGLKRKSLRVY